jgi:hypothetical protein
MKSRGARKEDSHWIWVAGGPLDQSPIAFQRIGNFEDKRSNAFRHLKARNHEEGEGREIPNRHFAYQYFGGPEDDRLSAWVAKPQNRIAIIRDMVKWTRR